jgi:hypothetical protein
MIKPENFFKEYYVPVAKGRCKGEICTVAVNPRHIGNLPYWFSETFDDACGAALVCSSHPDGHDIVKIRVCDCGIANSPDDGYFPKPKGNGYAPE